MARGVSTVVDVAVCLLLVGVAVATLTAAVPDADRSVEVDADPVADSLTTVTTTVPATGERSVHGTVAEQFANAAIVGATLGGEPVTASPYPDAVEREAARQTPPRTHVTVRWAPYPGAPLASRLEAGRAPPDAADVAVTTRTFDTGVGADGIASADSFEALAESLAEAYVDRLFPPERVRVQLVDARTAEPTAMRYRNAAETVGIRIERALEDASSRRLNDRLVEGLSRRLEIDLRASYETVEAARADLRIGHVEIVVRRWEP